MVRLIDLFALQSESSFFSVSEVGDASFYLVVFPRKNQTWRFPSCLRLTNMK